MKRCDLHQCISAHNFGPRVDPDGRILAAAYQDRLDLWDVASPARPRLLRTLAFDPVPGPWPSTIPDRSQGEIAFSPDGHILACATGHDNVVLWNVTNPAKATRVATLPGQAVVGAIAFSPDGHLLADVSYDGTVILFNVTDPARAATMRTLAAARLPEYLVGTLPPGALTGADYSDTDYAVVFSPDGRNLTAAVSSQPEPPPYTPGAGAGPPPPSPPARETVSVWNVTNPAAVARITTFSRTFTGECCVSRVALAAGGRTVARGAPPEGNSTVDLWTLP